MIVLDPMLATGNSSVAAIDARQGGGRALGHARLPSSPRPRGSSSVHDDAPRRPHRRRAVDRGLNERGFIVPGLGDAGDRLYGTK